MKPEIILDDVNDESPKFKVGDLVKAKKASLGVHEAKWQFGLIIEVEQYSNFDPARKYFKWKYIVAWPDGVKKTYSAGALVRVNKA